MTRQLKCPNGRVGYGTALGTSAVQKGCGSEDIRVTQRLCNHSAFNGYHYTPSDWSELQCQQCGKVWRTRADVSSIPNQTDDDYKQMLRNIGCGAIAERK